MPLNRSYKEKAHQYLSETNRWLSELNSAATELMFLRRMLDIYGLKSSDTGHELQVIQMKKRMAQLLETLTSVLPERLHAHTDYLTKIVEDRLLLEDRELPYRHADLSTAIQDTRADFGKAQMEAFALIEELKRL